MTANPAVSLPRRQVKLDSLEALVGEVKRLREGSYVKTRQWNLDQICSHLAGVVEASLVKPPTDDPTPEQTARKEGFFAMVMGPGGMPEGIPLPPERVPKTDCGEGEVDRFIKSMETLEAYPHKCVTVGSCGPVPLTEIKPLHCLHASHHLSFLVPIAVPVVRRDNLSYADADEAIADIRHLEHGYEKVGNWSLPQACWHLSFVLNYFMSPGPHDELPVTEVNRQRLAALLSTGKISGKIDSPERAVPPTSATDADVLAFIATLERFKTFEGPFAPHRIFGSMTAEQGRRMAMIHMAHHLSYLVPTT